jgi:hypothetical protein
MNKQALKTIEIETFPLSTSAALDELGSVSEDSEAHLEKPETRRRAALRGFVDTLALAGAGMAGVYVGVWLDPPNVSGNQTSGKDETSPPQRGVATARDDADGWPFV